MSSEVNVKGLSKRFGALVAVDDVSFTARAGEVVGFLGPNGAGKSTTMKMITGFLRPSAGQVTVCGFDIAYAPLEVKRRIGYLPEGAPCYGDMKCGDYLAFAADLRNIPAARRAERMDAAIEQMQLGSVLAQRIETLSKGFKRRVGFAQALLHDPEVLILDEPTDGLDPNQKHHVRGLIQNLSKDKTVIISTHILEEVDAVCNRAMIISSGRIVADDTPQGLASRLSQQADADAPADMLDALNRVFRELTAGALQ